MRLWHKDLIPILPRQQLIAQWRECCCIARNIAVNGTPNHLLVNKILRYPIEHFYKYGLRVRAEMLRRGYSCDYSRFTKWFPSMSAEYESDNIFEYWHDNHYKIQCYYNLQEKYDCGGITEEEWDAIRKEVRI